jgi:hypothetical protein
MNKTNSELKAGIGITINNLDAIAYHLEIGKDNGDITKEALALFLRSVADDMCALDEDTTSLNEQIRLLKEAGNKLANELRVPADSDYFNENVEVQEWEALMKQLEEAKNE